jgi:cell division protein FtsB
MIEKIKSKVNYVAQNITDIRVLGQVIFGILVLLVSWSCVKTIQTNANLQKHIARMEQEVEVQKLQNENLKLKNKFLETDEFLELAARRQFGKAVPGEKLITVPKNVALARTVDLTKDKKKKTAKAEASQPTYERNLEAWRNFFFHTNN